MDVLIAGPVVFLLVLILLATGVWIFAAMMLASVVALLLLLDFPLDRIGVILKGIAWRSVSTWEVAAIPMFIWMGELVFRSNISERLFRGLAPITDRVPGRLLHTNVFGCTLFAAVSGSTAATTATVGKITTSELAERRYDPGLAIGSLAGAGSLGLMIPPSIVFIVYGLLAELSIAKLFIAGIMPGLMIAGLYSLYIATRCWYAPHLAPASGATYRASDYFFAFVDLLPVLVLVVIVLGGIYTGIATPSEAAAVGTATALIYCKLAGQLTVKMFKESIMSALVTSCMVGTLLMAATVLSTAMGYLHIPQNLARLITEADLPPYLLIIVIALFYLVLGMFLEGISITVMTLPIVLPMIVAAGFDALWFGVFLVLMIELATITPPIGFNLFILQGLTGRSISWIAWASFPFFLLMCLATIMVTVFPNIALWLPSLM
jgi:tripartite ATP-independent transporter DctM subunit